MTSGKPTLPSSQKVSSLTESVVWSMAWAVSWGVEPASVQLPPTTEAMPTAM